MVTWEPFELPCGIEAAILKLARDSKQDGYSHCTPQIHDGRISYVSLFDNDGVQHFIRPCGSNWEEMRESEGADKQ